MFCNTHHQLVDSIRFGLNKPAQLFYYATFEVGRGFCFNCKMIDLNRDTSRLDFADFGLKSHNLAIRSHSVPGSISSGNSATNCFSAFLWKINFFDWLLVSPKFILFYFVKALPRANVKSQANQKQILTSQTPWDNCKRSKRFKKKNI